MSIYKIINVLTVLTVLTIVFAASSCGGAEGRKDKYLAKGIEYLDNNNIDKARLEFKNVLQIDPKSAEGHFYMAQVNEKLKDFRKALGGYTKAIELKTDYVDALTGSGRIYIIANMPVKAIEFADKALVIDPVNLEALAVRAGGLYSTGEIEKSLKILRASLDSDPDHLASLALLSRIYLTKHQVEKAEVLLASSLQRKPEDEGLQTLLVQLYSDSKQFEKATQVMQQLVKTRPELLAYRNRLAYFYDALGDKKKAEAVLRAAVKDLPENMDAKRSLIQYLAEKRDIMIAQVELASFIKTDESNPDLKLISAMLYRQTKDNNKAEAIYREIIKKYGTETASVKAHYELTRLLLSEKRPDEAKTELAKLLAIEPTHNEGLTMRGMLSLAEKDARSSIADFRSVLKDQPQSVKHMKLLAQALLSEGQFELAQKQLMLALHFKPDDIASRLALAKIFYREKQTTDAIEQLNVVLELNPDNTEAKDLIFKSFLAERNYAQAIQLAIQMEKDQPQNVKAYFYHGLVLQAQQKLQASLEKFDEALRVNPEAIEPLSSYVRVALALKQPKKAQAKLKAMVKEHPDYVVAQNLLGEVLLQQNKSKLASEAFAKAIEMNDKWWIPYRNLASTQVLMKQPGQAIATYRKGVEKAEQGSRLITQFATLLEQQEKVNEAIRLYEDVLVSTPASVDFANNLAMLLVEHQHDQPSKDRALSLVNQFQTSQNPVHLDTLGWVHYKRGEYEKALSALLTADSLAPEQPLIHYHLGSVYFSKGNNAQARKFLKSVTQSNIASKTRKDAQRMLSAMDNA